ncbi:hypothetical protein ANCDUO_12400 [Ancylostoma duodenale]|uniref:Uncharacterized protein n=1 Tax=Ancylostoma duodenale TaxID=51022 RepID=A0A0C2CLI9_9BILA|nr:hypothetical protein ANCDUO_12400 [Ancylostoma duodenale]
MMQSTTIKRKRSSVLTPQNGDKLYESQQGVCGQCPQGTTCVASLCRSDKYEPDLKANPLPDCPNPQPGRLGDDKMTYDMQMTARDMANYYRFKDTENTVIKKSSCQ